MKTKVDNCDIFIDSVHSCKDKEKGIDHHFYNTKYRHMRRYLVLQ